MNAEAAPPRLRLAIRSRLDHVFLVGQAVWGLCRHAGFTESAADGVELCVVEAVTNAIRHAYREADGHWVDVSFTMFPDRLSVAVSHGGHAPSALPSGKTVCGDGAAPLQEGGMGLAIIHRVMDRVRYETDGNVHWLTMEIDRPDDP